MEVQPLNPSSAFSAVDAEQGHWTLAAVETAVDAIITIDEMGSVEYLNPAAQRMFGFAKDEIVGKNVNILMPAPYRERHDGYLKNYRDTGIRKIIGIGREVMGRRKDGTAFPISLAVSEVHFAGRRIFTGVIHDISERRRAQEEKDHLLHQLNRRNRELSCLYRVGELVRPGDISPDIYRKVVDYTHAAIANATVSGTQLTIEGEVYVSEPFQQTPWFVSAPITVLGGLRGLLEVFLLEHPSGQDGREAIDGKQNLLNAVARGLAEAMERTEAEAKVIHASKLASIGELAAGVGHEINNPINGIINCADLLLKQVEPDSKARQFAELIRSEADRIAVIVQNLLTFSRQDKQQFSAARPCDIVDVVLNLCGKRLAKSHVQLDVNVPDALPRINCRSEQLQQVLMNLIINAVHSLDERYPGADPGKTLRIEAEQVPSPDGPMLRLIVRDNGTGIAPEHAGRIFDPFFTTKGRDKGTGLGLAISDGIVKAHNGTIIATSKYGQGAAFRVDLPMGGAVAPTPTSKPRRND